MKKYSLKFINRGIFDNYSVSYEVKVDSLSEILEILEKSTVTNEEYVVIIDNLNRKKIATFTFFGMIYETAKSFFNQKYSEAESPVVPLEPQGVLTKPDFSQEILDEMVAQRETVIDYTEKIDSQFKELRTILQEYKKCVTSTFHNTAFRDLAILMRDAENNTADPQTGGISAIFANRLYDIFLKFGIESIEPDEGETLNPQLHEKYDLNSSGNTITNTITKGWKFGEDVLLKAVVKTD